MSKTIKIINGDEFLKEFEEMQCGKRHVAQIGSRDFEMKQYETKPLSGFQFPEGFPFCCENHKSLHKIGQEKLNLFPNCCEPHKKLNEAPWFNISDYQYLPYKFASSMLFTWHCISESIQHDNWFKEITDYIDYTKNSYGQFPDGFGSPLGIELYLHNLERRIDSENGISKGKKSKLIDFIKNYSTKTKDIEPVDLNLLISKYKEWLKIFPFDISFFRHLKAQLENRMPILKGEGTTNIYSGLTGFHLWSKDELIKTLTDLTLFILKEINTVSLYEKGILTQPTQIQLELLKAKRKLELEELEKFKTNEKKEYIRLLKKWLKGEKDFLKELNPILKDASENESFINDLLDGIKQLQINDTNAACIMNVRKGNPDKETTFRYWFKDFFTARYQNCIITAEEEKGNGRIDLKINSKNIGIKVIEFKGWWNQTKAKSVEQVCSYLTDFEKEGYIFMINHNKDKDIAEDYKQMIIQKDIGYIKDSWKEFPIVNSDLSYFQSKHKFNIKEKTIYHFIFNVYF